MPANPRLLTLGDTVWSHEAMPGDILVLDENVIPTWGPTKIAEYLDPATATVGDLIRVLVDAGLMKSAGA